MDKKILFWASVLVFLVSTIALGISGAKSSLALIIIFLAPLALLLSKSGFSTEESIILGLFVALGIIPTIVYYPGLLVSIKIIVTILLAIMLLAWVYLSK